MVRSTRILEVIEADHLLDHARARGAELVAALEQLEASFPGVVSNARGRGLFCAIDLPSTEARNVFVKRCFDAHLLVLAGGHRTVRFRPALTVESEQVALAAQRLREVLARGV
jgi:L-lysine 6-transaminase